MARKDRTLAGFGDVAGNDKEIDNNNNDATPNVNPNGGSNADEQENGDYLDKMLNDGLPKKAELVLHGLYLEPDLSKLLNKLAAKGGRGAKSRITNDAFRKYFTDKGLL